MWRLRSLGSLGTASLWSSQRYWSFHEVSRVFTTFKWLSRRAVPWEPSEFQGSRRWFAKIISVSRRPPTRWRCWATYLNRATSFSLDFCPNLVSNSSRPILDTCASNTSFSMFLLYSFWTICFWDQFCGCNFFWSLKVTGATCGQFILMAYKLRPTWRWEMN